MLIFNKDIPRKRLLANGAWPLLTILGLSFLFFTGFPFENHNESYSWLVFFDKMGFVDILTTRIDPVQSFRPLGTATAWISYKLTNDIHLQQIINWIFASLSFIILYRQAPNKPVFAIASFLGTSAFFAGYIYLFHLHGVFYGPLQLFIAILTCLAFNTTKLSAKHLILLFFFTVLIALYHTFALIVFIAFLSGSILQLKKIDLPRSLPVIIFLLFASIYTIYIIISIYKTNPSGDAIQGGLTSFKTTEINFMIRFVASLFAIYTVATTNINSTLRHFYIIATVLGIILFSYFKLPILLIWIFACILKAIALKRWAMAAIIASTAVFPVPTHTGTPTYVVFVIMVCLFVMTMHSQSTWRAPAFIPKSIYAFALLMLLITLALKAGTKLPLVGKLVNPILAEQEKTWQMKQILQWRDSATPYRAMRLRFADINLSPALSTKAIHRQNRPPTRQFSLDYYSYKRDPTVSDTSGPNLLVTFGNKKLKNLTPVFKVGGKWNGPAYVY